MNMNNFLEKLESQNNQRVEFCFGFDKFGTKINFSVVADKKLEAKVNKIFLAAKGIYEKYDRIFNRFEEKSEISRLNCGVGKFQDSSKEILEAASKSLSFNRETAGYFDPRVAYFLEKAGYDEDFSKMKKIQEVEKKEFLKIEKDLKEDLKIEKEKVFFGRKMDFSGIVKGMVNDKVAEFFSKEGFVDFVVDSGGDIFFSGKDNKEEDWTVDVEGIPYEKLVLEISGKGVATSGIAKRKWEKGDQRKHHLINPMNPGDFKFDLRTVTVIDLSTERADVWAKTLFLMGKESGMKYSKEKGISCLFLDYNGNAWASPEFSKYRI